MSATKLKTGVAGLDLITGGGFAFPSCASNRPRGSILVRGEAGTGKTLLALTLSCAAGHGQTRATVLYLGIDQAPADVKTFAGEFPLGIVPEGLATAAEWTEDPKVIEGTICVINAMDPVQLVSRDPATWAQVVRKQLDDLRIQLASNGRVVVACVVDGIPQGAPLAANLDRLSIQEVAKYGSDNGLIMIITEEEGSAPGWLSYACDVVIELTHAPEEIGTERPMRRLVVRKSRFSAAVEGSHPYEINESYGFALYPALHSYSRRKVQKAPAGGSVSEQFGWAPLDVIPHLRGSLVAVRGNDQPLVDAIATKFLMGVSNPEREFAASLNIEPRNVTLGFLYGTSQAEEFDWLGDIGTPPEKLFALVGEALVRRSKEAKKTLARIRIGNLASLEGFPVFERFYQCLQLLVREFQARRISVLMSMSPALSRLTSFREDTSVSVVVDATGWRIDVVSAIARAKYSRRFDVTDLGFTLLPDSGERNPRLPGI